MVLVETDIILALISEHDRHHNDVTELLEKRQSIVLSPYSLTELDLLIKSGTIVISDIEAFYLALDSLLRYRRIETLPSKPAYHATGFDLRRRFRQLTYFDSLHAGVAIAEDLLLISYDKIYAKITGLKYSVPAL